jgi:hypothetical protein
MLTSWTTKGPTTCQRLSFSLWRLHLIGYRVFNGDLITGVSLTLLELTAAYVVILAGENVYAFNATKYLDQVFAPTVARKIPFSSTHGNVSFIFAKSRPAQF